MHSIMHETFVHKRLEMFIYEIERGTRVDGLTI